MPTGQTDFHDANGNLLTDCTHTYTWDANNHPLSIDTVNLTYDALGRMVEQNNAGVFTEILYSPIGKLAVMHGQTFQRIYVPFPGGGFGVNDKSLGFHNRHVDWLGSERFGSTLSRILDHDNAFAPYGENYAGAGARDLDFTGQDQDTVSGMYDFLYREYSPAQGRWISPDPAGIGAVNPTNPQSWNRYAYVGNAPLTNIDRTGLLTLTIDGGLEIDLSGGWFAIPIGVFGQGIGGSVPQWILPGENSTNWPDPYSAIARIEDILSGNWARVFGLDLSNCNPICDATAANNGPAPRVSCNQTTGICVPSSMVTGPSNAQRLWKGVKWYLCGNGSFDNIKNYTLEGFTKGVIVGGIAGWEGGPPGVALGALGGGVEGWFGGSALGIVAAGACQAAGMYGPAS